MSKLKSLVSEGAGRIDPISVDEYLGIGGYDGLKKACTMKPLEGPEKSLYHETPGSHRRS